MSRRNPQSDKTKARRPSAQPATQAGPCRAFERRSIDYQLVECVEHIQWVERLLEDLRAHGQPQGDFVRLAVDHRLREECLRARQAIDDTRPHLDRLSAV